MNISTASKWIGFIVMIIIVTACSQEESTNISHILEKYEEVRIPAELVMEVFEPDDILFGQLGSVAADMNGNIYVVDRQFYHIMNITPDGDILETVGREGDGPGEYRFIGNMFVARDTMYVYDTRHARLVNYARNQDGTLSRIRDLDIQLVDGLMARGVLKSRNNYVVEGFGMNDTVQRIGFMGSLQSVLTNPNIFSTVNFF
ncbi:MAG: 6-bladed beta-propeller [Balneolales bacterium]|nr:6-bladed beta-propeller [Balneolales bacterium]